MRGTEQQARFALKMRRHMTKAEGRLWFRLRRLGGWDAQLPVCGYIVDFGHKRRRLAIEVDGSSHHGKEGYDSERDALLERAGWRVFRFSNESVLAEVEAVVVAIQKGVALSMLPRLDPDAEKPRPNVGDAVQFGCAVRRWKRLHPPVEPQARLVKR